MIIEIIQLLLVIIFCIIVSIKIYNQTSLYDDNQNYQNKIVHLNDRKTDLLNQILNINQKIQDKTSKIQKIDIENQEKLELLKQKYKFQNQSIEHIDYKKYLAEIKNIMEKEND